MIRSPSRWAGAIVALVLASCTDAPEPGALAGWNVVLVTIDTLRADHLGFMDYAGAETPVLDGLADGGVVFEKAISSSPVTLPSHATILTGRYPPAHGALDNGFFSLPEEVPTLAGRLKNAGYETAAVVGAYVLHGQYGLNAGFDRYDDFFVQPRADGVMHRERRAEEVSARGAEWLQARSGDRPFFLWVHYYDPHVPYDPPGKWRTRFATRPYDGEIAYTDEAIGALLDALAAAGHADRTLIVVTADHGEALGDGGERTHGLLLRRPTLHVPLVLSAPGALPAGRRVRGLVAAADVTPTVLDLLGIAPGDGLDGVSLIDCIPPGRSEGRDVYSETRLPTHTFGWATLAGARNDRWSWVRAPQPELYDLETDPGETRSVHEENPETVAILDRRVEEVLGRQVGAAARESLPEEEVEALRALGYLFSTETPESTGADPKERIGIWNRVNDMRELLGQSRFVEAADGLGSVLEEDPGNHEARILLGEALVRAGRVDDGLRELEVVRESGRLLGRHGDTYARTLAEAGRPDEAEAVLRALQESEPEEADHAFNLGVLLSGQERHAEAAAAYDAALRINPDAVHVVSNLAMAIASLSGKEADPERALALADRAIELGAGDDRPRLVKASVCRKLGRQEDSREILRALANQNVLRGITRQEVAAGLRQLQ